MDHLLDNPEATPLPLFGNEGRHGRNIRLPDDSFVHPSLRHFWITLMTGVTLSYIQENYSSL